MLQDLPEEIVAFIPIEKLKELSSEKVWAMSKAKFNAVVTGYILEYLLTKTPSDVAFVKTLPEITEEFVNLSHKIKMLRIKMKNEKPDSFFYRIYQKLLIKYKTRHKKIHDLLSKK
ncbi:MAG: hypothetical protein JW841_07075 [Deltaproteobacteria bacterium]|nr:hypothetical protein [Deltaproteobacteria bacterium]